MGTVRVLITLSLAGAVLAQDVPTGVVKSGAVSLLRSESKTSIPVLGTIESTLDLFAGGFQSTDYTNYTAPPPPTVTTIDPCVILAVQPSSAPVDTGVVVTALDAGPVLNLNGPKGTKQFAATAKMAYGGTLGGGTPLPIPGAPAVPPLFLDPGTYTVDNGGGGADIGPFTAMLTVPDPAFTWTNADDNSTIDRSAGVQLNWTGGDPASKVGITGSVILLDSANKTSGGAIFVCTVDNTGGFFLSSDVLSLLPASPVSSNPLSVPTSFLTLAQVVTAKFDAPGSDTNSFSFNTGATRNVTYK